ncbi:hypothetical protein FISHEDRAFT_65843 [Fistulina hepatica ATCC 64428]|uniref:Uncharacterized protein n=1 Tax=Fistulina hepatica ATCC 64428 TaxID=1128425 RepID=A0A0D7ACI0_9AGAR|nr:hypothetical protein FISHEDRAFT_65843 [Fistulina hepatica ATCC 64428]
MSESFCSLLRVLHHNPLRKSNLDLKDGISLLSLKHHMMLSYLQSLALLNARRALGHTLTARTLPAETFSDPARSARGNGAGDLVDYTIEGRVVLEKIKTLEGRMRYQIDKLIRLAEEPERGTDIVNDPLAFRPNPQNLVNADGDEDGNEDEEGPFQKGDSEDEQTKSGVYRPPRLAPVPYNPLPNKKQSKHVLPPSTSLRALADPDMPHVESTSGLGSVPSLQSGRAHHLKRLNEYEEDNFTRVVMKKRDAKRRLQDEEDLALGGDLSLGSGVGKNRRKGGVEDEFGGVLRDVERSAGRRHGVDAYEELRRRAKKGSVLERSRTLDPRRKRQRTRFEREARQIAKRSK